VWFPRYWHLHYTMRMNLQRYNPHPQYWLMKSEPEEVSVDHLATMPSQTVAWFGVRNYQARNFMRDVMRIGDGVLFYHSSCAEPGIAGVAKVASNAYPDATQFDTKSKYFDPKSNVEDPRWMLVDVKLTRKTKLLPLQTLRATLSLSDMVLLQKGSRLSITPITPMQWQLISEMLK
jgi:predicted RNA-binding protein with PUA-like domain